MTAIERLRGEARDLLELVLLPGLAALLPWPLCFRLFRACSRWGFLYRESCDEALKQAMALGAVHGDPALWQQARRLVTLVDHADFFLARTRSDRWMRRHLTVQGEWPAPSEAAILCTFHWGAGMWGLRHAASRGLHARALIAQHRREAFAGRRIRYAYYTRRIGAVADALGRPPIEVTNSPRPILEALRGGENVLAAVDVPADQVAASEVIMLHGHRARVPRALLRIAVEQQIPVTVYLTGVRMNDGQRTLRVVRLGVFSDVSSLLAAVFEHLEAALGSDSAAWHFWAVAPRFFDFAVSSEAGR